MFQFPCRFAFLSAFLLSNRTPKITRILKVDKKANLYTRTEAYKLYSRVFGIFLPNVIKSIPYNFEVYRFKVGAFFETLCRRILTLFVPMETGMNTLQCTCLVFTVLKSVGDVTTSASHRK